ncbi:3-phosphoshikimate 1-carboxyvinyltransferase [Acidihalobacter prosperus]
MLSREQTFHVRPGGAVTGQVRVPGDKSISHRSIMLGAIADGVTEISGFLEGADCLATLQSMQEMGVKIDVLGHGHIRVNGVGLHGLKTPVDPLDFGNSGTAMRLMTGLLAGQEFNAILKGDQSLSNRPMGRIIEPLVQMGATIEAAENNRPPLHIRGGNPLTGICYEMKVASAQVKSALLLAGLYASGETCVIEPAPTRDHTERMLAGFGYPIQRNDNRICLQGGGRLKATRVEVPADISSAAFFIVAATLMPGSELLLEHVGVNPTRTGVIDILRLMGANIDIFNQSEVGGELVADLRVRHAALHGIDIPEALVPLAIDEFPVIFIAAANASGTTRLTGASELRVKESDRIKVMADGLLACGIQAQATPDGIIIQGKPGQVQGARIDSQGDHRIAMAFAVAGQCASSPMLIDNCANVATSFPGFAALAKHVGLDIEINPSC